MGRLVTDGLSTSFASVDDYKATFGVWLGLYGAQNTAASVCSVTRVYIHMKRAEAKWAVIARGVSKGQNLLAAGNTGKAAVVFCKSFVFHKPPFPY